MMKKTVLLGEWTSGKFEHMWAEAEWIVSFAALGITGVE